MALENIEIFRQTNVTVHHESTGNLFETQNESI
jgi:hypothetical protein